MEMIRVNKTQNSFSLSRMHLTRHIENEGLQQKLIQELQLLVEDVYGDQEVDKEVLEKEYVEQVLLLRKV